MNIYLASRYSRLEEMRGYRRELNRSGHNVTSRWLSGQTKMPENASYEDNRLRKALEREALECYEDICNSDVLVHFNEEPRARTRGGRHTELGIAIERGIFVVCVGLEPEQLFHYLPRIYTAQDWEDCKFILSYLNGKVGG